MEKRVVIYPKDVEVITGKSERFGRRIIKLIKRAHGKTANQFVSIEEFCFFTGLDVEEVKHKLKIL